jgi:hypothetical protein
MLISAVVSEAVTQTQVPKPTKPKKKNKKQKKQKTKQNQKTRESKMFRRKPVQGPTRYSKILRRDVPAASTFSAVRFGGILALGAAGVALGVVAMRAVDRSKEERLWLEGRNREYEDELRKIREALPGTDSN